MDVKTEHNQICIYLTEKEANWLNDELDNLDIPENGLICLNVLKDVLTSGIYLKC